MVNFTSNTYTLKRKIINFQIRFPSHLKNQKRNLLPTLHMACWPLATVC